MSSQPNRASRERRGGGEEKGERHHVQISLGDVQDGLPVLEALGHETLIVLNQADPEENLFEVGHALGSVRCQNGARDP